MTDQVQVTKVQFIEFLLAQNVLKFGEFTLKSGRQSPYFFNLGEVSLGTSYKILGEAYADTIIASGVEFDVLFGPAYKGIPIAVATAMALSLRGRSVGVAYNRKEAKSHGEGGSLVGASVTGRVVLIDDVLTSGKAIREAVQLIDNTNAQIVGAVIAMDRQEVRDSIATDDTRIVNETSAGAQTAVEKLQGELSAPVMSISNLTDLIHYLESAGDNEEILGKMKDYQSRYCVGVSASP